MNWSGLQTELLERTPNRAPKTVLRLFVFVLAFPISALDRHMSSFSSAGGNSG